MAKSVILAVLLLLIGSTTWAGPEFLLMAAKAQPALPLNLTFESDTVDTAPSGITIETFPGGSGPVNAISGAVVTDVTADTGGKSLKITSDQTMYDADGFWYYDWVVLHITVPTLGNTITFRYKMTGYNGGFLLRDGNGITVTGIPNPNLSGAWTTATLNSSTIAGTNVPIQLVMVDGTSTPGGDGSEGVLTFYIDNIQF